ncbi:ECF transporter S component [Acidothermaceae bacterium B102]|nr:ECF transporter S component [Acidothermaceae bacterium B102]
MQDLKFNPRPRVRRGWRTVDVVVAAVVSVAFGVVFWAWSQLYTATSPAFSSIPPVQGLMVGMWLVPGVLGGLILRRPGAALFCEFVASIVEMLLGNQWGTTNMLYGFFEGLAPELLFALFLYRRWNLPVALLAGGAAGVADFCLDWFYAYPTYSIAWLTAYGAAVLLSCVVIAGAGSWVLARALAVTGVLSVFSSGREQAAV